MKIKFWGTRGSLPQAISHQELVQIIEDLSQKADDKGIHTLPAFLKAIRGGDLGLPLTYGGNTTCTELSQGSTSVFVDMGSGLREAGTHHMKTGVKDFHIFLTHMHWDHIMGLPFFIPIHVPGCTVTIYHVHKNTPEYVKINFNGVNFPLTVDQLQGSLKFVQLKLYESTQCGEVAVTPFVLDHPGGCFGYRFEGGGRSVAVGVDGEFKRVSRQELGRDLPYYQNLDLLVFDAQYEISELASKFDWGHCTPTIGADLALREGIRNLVLTHHDPWSTTSKLRRMEQAARRHIKTQMPDFLAQWQQRGQEDGPNLVTAYDGLVLDLDEMP